jgi:hypothetical protein
MKCPLPLSTIQVSPPCAQTFTSWMIRQEKQRPHVDWLKLSLLTRYGDLDLDPGFFLCSKSVSGMNKICLPAIDPYRPTCKCQTIVPSIYMVKVRKHKTQHIRSRHGTNTLVRDRLRRPTHHHLRLRRCYEYFHSGSDIQQQ